MVIQRSEDLVDRSQLLAAFAASHSVLDRIRKEVGVNPFIYLGSGSHYYLSDAQKLINYYYDPNRFTWEEIMRLYVGGQGTVYKLVRNKALIRNIAWGVTYEIDNYLLQHILALYGWKRREDYDGIKSSIIEQKTARRDHGLDSLTAQSG